MSDAALYDRLGVGYTTTRRPDPRIAAAIHTALGDAVTVVNIGAGAGAYEPEDRKLVAIEPSRVMIAQRPPAAAPAIVSSAEALPLADDSVDAAMAILTDHHWADRAQGLREMRRVARRRAIVFQHDPQIGAEFWLARDYLPTFVRRLRGKRLADLMAPLGDVELRAVPIPHDCADGFLGAFWRRPHAYLDPEVRAGISVFRLLPEDEVAAAVRALRADLESGAWARRNADILEREELDLGFRVVVAEYA
ncbi:MAG TPA: methyltransferase domain-containing protein [Solirubrobacteraceae bacterium]|nr:methyltransferase domain-containing protein [Solirubrobacteraceae bacterium]